MREYLKTWNVPDTNNLPYLIRNEEDYALANWYGIVDPEVLTAKRIQLQSAIRLGIAQLFKIEGYTHKVHLLPVSQQRREARKVIGDRKTLSLDPFFEGTARMDSTRFFEPSSAQFKPLYRGPRPGYAPLEKQALAVPEGEYVLVEDDVVTGGTVATTIALLPSNVKIVDQVILSDFADYAGVDYYDVVDLRDFIIGSRYGGLSVLLGHRPGLVHARAPYVMPFVSLRARAKIPAGAEKELSRIIWQANHRFFQGTGIRVSNTDVGFQNLAVDIGYDLDRLMEDFCMDYVEKMIES